MHRPKIFICGPSGTGKTTLAHHISQKFNIPFISTSGKVLWDYYGIESHQQLIDMTNQDPLGFGLEYQITLLKHRNAALEDSDSFVTDRSPVDNLVYTISQLSAFLSEKQIKEYIEMCEISLRLGNQILYIPFTDKVKLDPDGARIVNPFYQQYIGSLFDMVLYKHNYLSICRGCTIRVDDWDWKRRIQFVEFCINKKFKLYTKLY
jgi:molybdopterin-guanine dinucleotide biosynthesis protein